MTCGSDDYAETEELEAAEQDLSHLRSLSGILLDLGDDCMLLDAGPGIVQPCQSPVQLKYD